MFFCMNTLVLYFFFVFLTKRDEKDYSHPCKLTKYNRNIISTIQIVSATPCINIISYIQIRKMNNNTRLISYRYGMTFFNDSYIFNLKKKEGIFECVISLYNYIYTCYRFSLTINLLRINASVLQ